MAIGRIYRELLRGKSVGRALQNDALAPVLARLTGHVLDLAGGSGSYYRYLPDGLAIVRTNVHDDTGTYAVDMNETLPYPDESFDAVLLLNALYIAPHPQAVLAEIQRVLKQDGIAYVTTPYLANEMREPHDYWRFTSEGIGLIARQAGFVHIEVHPVGERFTVALNLICMGPLRILALALILPALLFDGLLPRSVRARHPAPIGYVTELRL